MNYEMLIIIIIIIIYLFICGRGGGDCWSCSHVWALGGGTLYTESNKWQVSCTAGQK